MIMNDTGLNNSIIYKNIPLTFSERWEKYFYYLITVGYNSADQT